jgi:hypothetical protein
MSFFAVTPEFVSKCRNRLISKGRWDYDGSSGVKVISKTNQKSKLIASPESYQS